MFRPNPCLPFTGNALVSFLNSTFLVIRRAVKKGSKLGPWSQKLVQHIFNPNHAITSWQKLNFCKTTFKKKLEHSSKKIKKVENKLKRKKLEQRR